VSSSDADTSDSCCAQQLWVMHTEDIALTTPAVDPPTVTPPTTNGAAATASTGAAATASTDDVPPPESSKPAPVTVERVQFAFRTKWFGRVPHRDELSYACCGLVLLLIVMTAVSAAYTSAAGGVTEDLVWGILLTLSQYLLGAIVAASIYGWIVGRDRWWAGPYCSGFIGFGDGSAAPPGAEAQMEKWGMKSASPDLYFDAGRWALSDPPVRLSKELSLMGFRGRSEDPVTRPDDPRRADPPAKGKQAFGSSRHLGVEPPRNRGRRASLTEQIGLADAAEGDSTREAARSAAKTLTEDKALLRQLGSGQHGDSSKWLYSLTRAMAEGGASTRGEAPPSEGSADVGGGGGGGGGGGELAAFGELRDLFREIRMRERMAVRIQTMWRGAFHRQEHPPVKRLKGTALDRRCPRLTDALSDILDCLSQSMDNGRQNYRSLKLAAALVLLALVQAFSLAPVVPSSQTGLLELSVPGFGLLLVDALESSDGTRVWVIGTDGSYIWAMVFTYLLLALMWGLAGMGNVAWHRPRQRWPLHVSTLYCAAYLVWLCTQTWVWDTSDDGVSVSFPALHVLHLLLTLGILVAYLRFEVAEMVAAPQVDVGAETPNSRRKRLALRATSRAIRCLLRTYRALTLLGKGSCLIFEWFTAKQKRRQLFLGAHFPATLVAGIATSAALNTMLLFATLAVLPVLLSSQDTVVAYFNDTKVVVSCGNEFGGSLQQLADNIADSMDVLIDNATLFAWVIGSACAVGGVVGYVLVLQGISSTVHTYARTYDLLWHHGPSALRFPLRRANTVRFFSTFVVSQVFGYVMLLVLFLGIALVVLFAWMDWSGKYTIRTTLIVTIGFQLIEMLLLRSVFVPLLQRHKVGPLLFLIEVFYVNISVIKGLSRIVLLLVFTLVSFFTPAKCAFPDGKESWDSGHLCFVCYTMARVEADKEIQLNLSRRLLRHGINANLNRQRPRDSEGHAHMLGVHPSVLVDSESSMGDIDKPLSPAAKVLDIPPTQPEVGN